MIALAAALVLASVRCEDAAATRTRLTSAAANSTWSEQLKAVQERADPLPLEPPGSLAPKEAATWVADRLDAVCAARSINPSKVFVDRARLGAILARPEFTHESARRRALLQWIDRALDWILALLQSRGAMGFAQWTRAAVLGAGLVVAAFGLARLSRYRRKVRAVSARAEVPFVLAPAADHLALARSALTGDPRTAIRHGWLALLSALERRRLARPDRVKTNREIVSELPSRGASEALIAKVAPEAAWFDRRFYSLAPVQSEEAAGFLDRVAQLTSDLAEAP